MTSRNQNIKCFPGFNFYKCEITRQSYSFYQWGLFQLYFLDFSRYLEFVLCSGSIIMNFQTQLIIRHLINWHQLITFAHYTICIFGSKIIKTLSDFSKMFSSSTSKVNFDRKCSNCFVLIYFWEKRKWIVYLFL